MSKPAYVSVEYKRETGAETITIEGWLTHSLMDEPIFYITPCLDFDENVTKIGLLWSRIVSITPAQSVRKFAPHNSRGYIGEIAERYGLDIDNSLIEGEG